MKFLIQIIIIFLSNINYIFENASVYFKNAYSIHMSSQLGTIKFILEMPKSFLGTYK